MPKRPEHHASPARIIAPLAVAVCAVATDQASKYWALSALSDGHSQPLIGSFFFLKLTRNPGAAFSLGVNTTWIFTLISAVVIIGLIIYLPRLRNSAAACAVGLLLGGAIGNFIDRMIQEPGIGRGHVVDFIGYGNWFIGNVADIWIFLAVCAILVMSFADREAVPQVRK